MLHKVMLVIFLGNGKARLGVVGDDAAHDRVVRLNVLTASQPTEHIVEVLKTLVWLHILVSVGAQGLLLLLHFDHGSITINLF